MDKKIDTNELKSVMELAMRMAEIVRSSSEWHRRMTSNKLSQTGKSINYEALIPGAKVYFYKSPSAQEVVERGRKAKHLDHYTDSAAHHSENHRDQFICPAVHGRQRDNTHLSTGQHALINEMPR